MVVAVLRNIVYTDRTASWEAHLSTIQDSMAIFVAAGQTNCLKSAYLYIQTMLELPV